MQRALLVILASIGIVLLGGGCLDNAPNPDALRVSAGDDQSVEPGAEVTLTASATGGSPPYRFRWSIESQPDGENLDLDDINTNAEITVGPLETAGDFHFRVRVTDSRGATAVSFVTVAIGGDLQVNAEAEDPIVVVGDETQLSASLESGTNGLDNVTFRWQVISGSASLSSTSIDDPRVTINAAESVRLRVTVTATDEDTGDERLGIEDVFVVGVNDRTPQVIIENTGGVEGRIVLELFSRSAPNTVANFLRYVDDGYYDGLVWHRVPPNNFVIQTGAFERNEDGELVEREGERDPIASEADNGRSNVRGTISMALRGEDADSGTNQFFINIGDNTSLDSGPPAFTVFGRVVEGLEEVADAIAAVETGPATVGGIEVGDVPLEDIIMSSVRRATTEVPTDGDEDDEDPNADDIEIEATAEDPVVVTGQSTVLGVEFDDADVPGTPRFSWEIISGEGELSAANVRNPILTVSTNGAVQVQVVLRSSDGRDAVRGQDTVFVVGAATENPQVVLDVRSASGGPFSIAGEVIIELLPQEAPHTVANFLRYVDEGFYNNVVFHRVLANKLVQTGGYIRSGQNLTVKNGSHEPVESEADNGLSHVRGTVALALLGSNPDSGNNQFFINVADNTDLDDDDPPFTIFGRVLDGMDVIDEIAALETGRDNSGLTNVPLEDVIIGEAKRHEAVEDGGDEGPADPSPDE